MLPAGFLKKFIIILADYICVIVKDDSGENSKQKQDYDDKEADHSAFVLPKTLPGLNEHTSLFEFCVFHRSTSLLILRLNPRINESVKYIHNQIDQGEADGEDDNTPQYNRCIS